MSQRQDRGERGLSGEATPQGVPAGSLSHAADSGAGTWGADDPSPYSRAPRHAAPAAFSTPSPREDASPYARPKKRGLFGRGRSSRVLPNADAPVNPAVPGAFGVQPAGVSSTVSADDASVAPVDPAPSERVAEPVRPHFADAPSASAGVQRVSTAFPAGQVRDGGHLADSAIPHSTLVSSRGSASHAEERRGVLFVVPDIPLRRRCPNRLCRRFPGRRALLVRAPCRLCPRRSCAITRIFTGRACGLLSRSESRGHLRPSMERILRLSIRGWRQTRALRRAPPLPASSIQRPRLPALWSRARCRIPRRRFLLRTALPLRRLQRTPSSLPTPTCPCRVSLSRRLPTPPHPRRSGACPSAPRTGA